MSSETDDRNAVRRESRRRLILGWEEWVALPGLGLHAIKAKIDTGARTSALHAEAIERYVEGDQSWVRFRVRPSPRRPELVVACAAPVQDFRTVTSSNGIPENRAVIRTELEIDNQRWPIEISLSDRREMSYRMLLGRQALQVAGALIDPSAAFCQPRLHFKLYPGFKPRKAPRKSR